MENYMRAVVLTAFVTAVLSGSGFLVVVGLHKPHGFSLVSHDWACGAFVFVSTMAVIWLLEHAEFRCQQIMTVVRN